MTQKEALEILKMGHNVYLTGAPGSGKTFLLNEYINFLKGNGVVVGVTASTGVAATHLNGTTIHSWSGLGIKDALSEYDFDKLSNNKPLKTRIERTNVLVIDEVSMLHDFRLDLVDEVCRFFRNDPRSFGGIQVVLCGDFFQLPPISRGEKARFVSDSNAWNSMRLKVCYLHEQHRHCDQDLVQILKDIRINNVGEHTLAPLRKRYQKDTAKISPTKLYTHNADVDTINKRHLDLINEKEETYLMSVNKGSGFALESLKKSCLAPEKLSLKKGSAVMFVKNNPEKKYFNGTLGEVIGFDTFGYPLVKTVDGRKIDVKAEDWNMEEDGRIKASISQLPLRLAWAITIHKSQGMSLDAAEIDLSKSFVEGMGYVALSRVRTLEGLKLMGLNELALKVNRDVLILDEELVQMSERCSEELEEFSDKERERAKEEFIKSIASADLIVRDGKVEKASTYDITKVLVQQGLSIKEIAEEREMTESTIIAHLEKLVETGNKMNIEHLKPLPSRFEKIKEAFEKIKSKKLTPARKILGPYFSYDEIRLGRLFL